MYVRTYVVAKVSMTTGEWMLATCLCLCVYMYMCVCVCARML